MAPKPFLPRRDIRKVSKDLGLVGLLQRVGVRPAAERVTADVLVGLESRVRVQAADQEVSNEGRVGGLGGHFRSIEFRLFPNLMTFRIHRCRQVYCLSSKLLSMVFFVEILKLSFLAAEVFLCIGRFYPGSEILAFLEKAAFLF